MRNDHPYLGTGLGQGLRAHCPNGFPRDDFGYLVFVYGCIEDGTNLNRMNEKEKKEGERKQNRRR